MQHNQNKKAYRWRMVVFCLRVRVDCINVLETHFNCSGTIIPRQWRNSSECVQMHHMNRLRTYHKTSSNIRVQRVHISWDVLHLCLCTLDSWTRWGLVTHWSFLVHDDVLKWKHFRCYLPFVREIHRLPVNFLHNATDAEFYVFFDLHLNKRLSKQSWRRWFETPSRSLLRHCNESGNIVLLIRR